MNHNPKNIEQLKKEQKSYKSSIKKLQKRRFNDLFIIIMPLLILVVALEDYIVVYFSNSKSLIYFFGVCLAGVIALYLLIIRIKIRKIEKKIDLINEDIYKSMKLGSKK